MNQPHDLDLPTLGGVQKPFGPLHHPRSDHPPHRDPHKDHHHRERPPRSRSPGMRPRSPARSPQHRPRSPENQVSFEEAVTSPAGRGKRRSFEHAGSPLVFPRSSDASDAGPSPPTGRRRSAGSDTGSHGERVVSPVTPEHDDLEDAVRPDSKPSHSSKNPLGPAPAPPPKRDRKRSQKKESPSTVLQKEKETQTDPVDLPPLGPTLSPPNVDRLKSTGKYVPPEIGGKGSSEDASPKKSKRDVQKGRSSTKLLQVEEEGSASSSEELSGDSGDDDVVPYEDYLKQKKELRKAKERTKRFQKKYRCWCIAFVVLFLIVACVILFLLGEVLSGKEMCINHNEINNAADAAPADLAAPSQS
eukprot:Hpha_TRINITY_DN10341_c0_g1::TRINITY_DN10341_c0_g1_i1::g.116229::m.116229